VISPAHPRGSLFATESRPVVFAAMSETRGESVLLDVSKALVGLHKEQFGRGPRRAHTHFAGPDILVTVFEEALLPAEKALVDIGEQMRVLENRVFFQEATRDRFIETIEKIVARKIHSFHSTCDPRTGVVIEIAIFESPVGNNGDG
jgi:uncharacterized protein YbcI